ncbi:unnamed protein product [Moneuplotes crassus]|uniref:RING-type domain-containing protein n=1 Tax=Euplotes crassus TaxID=5936 RepID=A0AAD1U959_EUPCR|nr:unnamed protein product [Moneuplotes crassus]
MAYSKQRLLKIKLITFLLIFLCILLTTNCTKAQKSSPIQSEGESVQRQLHRGGGGGRYGRRGYDDDDDDYYNSNTSEPMDSGDEGGSSKTFLIFFVTGILLVPACCFVSSYIYFKCRLHYNSDRNIRIVHANRKVNITNQEKLSQLISSSKFSKENNIYDIHECTICLSDFKQESSISVIKGCKHIFHEKCLAEYFGVNRNAVDPKCPLCNCQLFKMR